jgi:hypothetical protein
VRLHDSDNHVLAAAVAANALTEHAVGLAHAGGIAEKQLENSLLFLRRDFLQPLFGTLLHELIVI